MCDKEIEKEIGARIATDVVEAIHQLVVWTEVDGEFDAAVWAEIQRNDVITFTTLSDEELEVGVSESDELVRQASDLDLGG